MAAEGLPLEASCKSFDGDGKYKWRRVNTIPYTFVIVEHRPFRSIIETLDTRKVTPVVVPDMAVAVIEPRIQELIPEVEVLQLVPDDGTNEEQEIFLDAPEFGEEDQDSDSDSSFISLPEVSVRTSIMTHEEPVRSCRKMDGKTETEIRFDIILVSLESRLVIPKVR